MVAIALLSALLIYMFGKIVAMRFSSLSSYMSVSAIVVVMKQVNNNEKEVGLCSSAQPRLHCPGYTYFDAVHWQADDQAHRFRPRTLILCPENFCCHVYGGQ